MRMRSSSSERKNFETPGVALAARTAAQLVVDASALVAFGPHDDDSARLDHLALVLGDLFADAVRARGALRLVVDPFQFLADAHVGVAAELDVGSAPGHVGGDGDGARNAGLDDDRGLLFVVAGIENLVRDLALLQKPREML